MGVELLIFILSPVINAWWDSAHGEVHHLRSWFIRAGGIIIAGVAMSFIFPNPWPEIVNSIWWLYIFIGATVEFLLFDYLYNWFTGNVIDYIGEEKWHKDDVTWKLYKKMEKAPEIVFTIKVFLVVVAVSLYFQLDRL